MVVIRDREKVVLVLFEKFAGGILILYYIFFLLIIFLSLYVIK